MSRRNGLFADESASDESQTETRRVDEAISDKKLAVSPFRPFAGSSSAFVSHFCLKMAFARTTALEFLRRAYEQNRLAHAYLITGPPGSGKELLAAEVASLVNGTPAKEVFSSNAQEIFIARPELKSRRISIEQIRELEHALQMRAANSRGKVAIISDADRLGDAAANAFLKTLEEPPKDSLLLLLSALPEALPETILSRCIAIPLASDGEVQSNKEKEKLVKFLQQASRQTTWSIQFAYRLAQEFQQLLRAIREEVKHETDDALKREQTRYKDATDGAWLEEREEYYKALTESLYLQRRAALVETLFAWWTDVLRASNDVAQRDIPAAKQETATLANRFSTAEILRRICSLEELRDHLGRNVHEGLAIEVAFLAIFIV
jgi:DNA polymerase-3 subunit delta'